MSDQHDVVMTPPGGAMSDAVRRGRGVAAWRQISDVIDAEIATGRYRPGMQLPTEAGLAARFGVNRHTVRQALADLAERGRVRATRGRGTFVSGPLTYPIGQRTRFSEIVVGAGLEPWGELLASREMAAEPAVATQLGLRDGAAALEMTTLHRAEGVPISTATTWLPLPRFSGFAALYGEHGSITRAFALCGIEGYRRLQTRIAARPASASERTRLELDGDAVVLVVESVNVDDGQRPIQATRSSFAASRVEFLVTT